MIFEPLNIATQYELAGSANTIDNAVLVACGNGSNSSSFVHITNAAGTRIASVMIPADDIIIIKKKRNEKVFSSTGAGGNGAGAAVNFTKIAFNN
jgi:hypothetical protein